MKKNYISPEVNITYVEAHNMIAASVPVTDVNGTAGIDMGEGETPDVANAKSNVNTVEWENWEDQEEQ